MDFSIFAVLTQDGLTNAAIYALLAMALILVFSVTRIILLPLGEFIGFGALTMVALQTGQFPVLIYLLVAMGVLAYVMDWVQALRTLAFRPLPGRRLLWSTLENIVYPVLIWQVVRYMGGAEVPMVVQIALTLAMTVPMGLMMYRIAFQPLADASVLVLLIVSVGVHFMLMGLGLYLFGPEGYSTTPFTDVLFEWGDLLVSGQSLFVVGLSVVSIGVLYLFFERSLHGKALRATAVSRRGALMVGIATAKAGRMAFGLATALGTLAGILVAPINTVAYDTGFVIALKGFVAAIVGGLASYPLAALGAVLVGLLESYSSFWASEYKEVIVFTLIIPVLAWLSLTSHHGDDE